MRAYVAYSKDVLFVAHKRLHTASLEEFVEQCREEAEQKEFLRRYKVEKPDMYLEEFIRKCKAEKTETADGENKEAATEIQKQMFLNLSEKDAHEIYFEIGGHIYPAVLLKMLDTFPEEISK